MPRTSQATRPVNPPASTSMTSHQERGVALASAPAQPFLLLRNPAGSEHPACPPPIIHFFLFTFNVFKSQPFTKHLFILHMPIQLLSSLSFDTSRVLESLSTLTSCSLFLTSRKLFSLRTHHLPVAKARGHFAVLIFLDLLLVCDTDGHLLHGEMCFFGISLSPLKVTPLVLIPQTLASLQPCFVSVDGSPGYLTHILACYSQCQCSVFQTALYSTSDPFVHLPTRNLYLVLLPVFQTLNTLSPPLSSISSWVSCYIVYIVYNVYLYTLYTMYTLLPKVEAWTHPFDPLP